MFLLLQPQAMMFLLLQLRDTQQQVEEEQRAREEARDQYQAAERRYRGSQCR